MEKIASQFRECLEEVERKRQGQKSLTHHEREDLEKQTAFDYAKANGLWVDNLYSLGKSTEVGGYENTLALDEQDNIIYKANNLFNSGFLISNLFKQLTIHNILFPETKYDFVGFTGFDNGVNRKPYVEVIIRQDFVKNAVQATSLEIENFMLSLDFHKINATTFSNQKYTVSDLHPRNVLKDPNGIIYVVDNITAEN